MNLKGKVERPPEPVEPASMGAPSPAWERLKAKPKRPALEQSSLKKSWECRCQDEMLENGEHYNPWVGGHFTRCVLFMAQCPDCGLYSGTHTQQCSFWTTHPLLTPF